MKIDMQSCLRLCLLGFLFCTGTTAFASDTIRIKVERATPGAPLTIGLPFAQGSLQSPDLVRVLDNQGREIACQTTQVTNWEPVDYSVKWLWVFFFSTGDEEYLVEYGPDVRPAPIQGDRIRIKNAQRTGQSSVIDTGPLRFTVKKGCGGFIDEVMLDTEGDGFDTSDTIAVCRGGRGSFLDLLDDLGIDTSTADITRTVRERGSGPLHSILRLEGNYTYDRDDNRDSPFVIRIHLYAGQSYIRVFHTLTYTGVPDKHAPVTGIHKNIALYAGDELINDSETADTGWTVPNDQIAATGLSLHYKLNGSLNFTTGYTEGPWWQPGQRMLYRSRADDPQSFSVFQTGPKPDRIPPVPNSSPEERIEGFQASIRLNDTLQKESARAEGWADLSDDRWGVSMGIRHFLEEYPKEIFFDTEELEGVAYAWSPGAGPMSFARASTRREQGMIDNFAEGITKTSELVFYFHRAEVSAEQVRQTMDYFLHPPVPHADAETYAQSKVYGQFSPRGNDFQGMERSLDYRFEWELFNQHWEPWYGMFDYGDQKNSYYRDDWHRWQNNEPAIDFMWWLQFMRTGNPDYYLTAEAMSRHTMDVDNIHWPTDPPYYGDTNDAIDYWEWKARKSTATPYLGIGRRHANQHWLANLSAHVWIEGWLAAYYLTGYHRGLDIARLTADSYTRRIWGEHGLTGRRLYLSIWNMVNVWDATKDPVYLQDLQDRIDRLLRLQNGPDQYDNLVIDRYGYSQVYATHGLYKYYQLTGEERYRQALIRHARATRDNPPYNHEYESYLATIHGLTIGYELTGEDSFLQEALQRAHHLKMDELKQSFEQLGTQQKIAEALEDASHLPDMGYFQTRSRWAANWSATQGLRVFGWTHIYNLPWLLHWLREGETGR